MRKRHRRNAKCFVSKRYKRRFSNTPLQSLRTEEEDQQCVRPANSRCIEATEKLRKTEKLPLWGHSGTTRIPILVVREGWNCRKYGVKSGPPFLTHSKINCMRAVSKCTKPGTKNDVVVLATTTVSFPSFGNKQIRIFLFRHVRT